MSCGGVYWRQAGSGNVQLTHELVHEEWIARRLGVHDATQLLQLGDGGGGGGGCIACRHLCGAAVSISTETVGSVESTGSSTTSGGKAVLHYYQLASGEQVFLHAVSAKALLAMAATTTFCSAQTNPGCLRAFLPHERQM